MKRKCQSAKKMSMIGQIRKFVDGTEDDKAK